MKIKQKRKKSLSKLESDGESKTDTKNKPSSNTTMGIDVFDKNDKDDEDNNDNEDDEHDNNNEDNKNNYKSLRKDICNKTDNTASSIRACCR